MFMVYEDARLRDAGSYFTWVTSYNS